MALVLLRRPGDPKPQEWPARFDSVREADLAALAGGYDAVLPADHLDRAPIAAPAARLAFHCTTLDALERLAALGLPGDLLFQPSALARLDLRRRTRPTLRAARPLPAGARLAEGDLATERGGPGIAAALLPAVLGRVLLYDLACGAPVDFGMIAADAADAEAAP